ncbi:MAG: SPASM domain-containing protein [Magnetococcus sp. WYHC-3]
MTTQAVIARMFGVWHTAYLRLRLRRSQRRGHRVHIAKWSNRLAVRTLRQRFDPAKTPDVFFEINTECNYHCPFCVQAARPRTPQQVTMADYCHVVTELQRLDFCGTLTLSVNNEPFLHPNLVDFCRRAAHALPRATIHLITNGSLATREHFANFAAMPRPPVITVNDYTPDHAIIRRLRGWLADPCFAGMPVALLPRSRTEVLSNRAGNLVGGRVPGRAQRLSVCTWPFLAIWISPALKVFLCCADYAQTMEVGDLRRQGLMEIWNASALQQVREAMLIPDRGRIPLCAKCDNQWWDLPRHCQPAASLSIMTNVFSGILMRHSKGHRDQRARQRAQRMAIAAAGLTAAAMVCSVVSVLLCALCGLRL